MELFKIRPSTRSAWRTCPRKVFYRSVAGVEPAASKRALVIGTAYHFGLETWRRTKSPAEAGIAAREKYQALCERDHVPFDETAWVQVQVYVEGYAKAFPLDNTAVLFEVPVFDEDDAEGGTADSVLRLPDGRVYVSEDKTTSRFDDPEVMAHALKMNDQVATYVWALRDRGVPVVGAFYRQVLKSGTKITLKENADSYRDRLRGIYMDPGEGKYREFQVTWTPSEMAQVRSEANRVSMEIVGTVERPSVKDWPFNPLSCIGPYGPCEYIKLCAKGPLAASDFKPTMEGPLDDGKFRQSLWPSSRGGEAETQTGQGGFDPTTLDDPNAGLAAFPDTGAGFCGDGACGRCSVCIARQAVTEANPEHGGTWGGDPPSGTTVVTVVTGNPTSNVRIATKPSRRRRT